MVSPYLEPYRNCDIVTSGPCSYIPEFPLQSYVNSTVLACGFCCNLVETQMLLCWGYSYWYLHFITCMHPCFFFIVCSLIVIILFFLQSSYVKRLKEIRPAVENSKLFKDHEVLIVQELLQIFSITCHHLYWFSIPSFHT